MGQPGVVSENAQGEPGRTLPVEAGHARDQPASRRSGVSSKAGF
jgi:hypothetical protein